MAMVSNLDKIDWKVISKKMSKRDFKKNPNQCKHRWNNHLNPLLKNEKWEKFEEEELLFLYEKMGPKWKKISDNLVGRSDNCIKNKFFSLIRKGLRNLLKFSGFSSKKFNINNIRPKILSSIYMEHLTVALPPISSPDSHNNKISVKINDFIFKDFIKNDFNKKTNKFLIFEILKYIDKFNKDYIVDKKTKIMKLRNKKEQKNVNGFLRNDVFKIKRNRIFLKNAEKTSQSVYEEETTFDSEFVFKKFLNVMKKHAKFYRHYENQNWQKTKKKVVNLNYKLFQSIQKIKQIVKSVSEQELKKFSEVLISKFYPEMELQKSFLDELNEEYKDIIINKKSSNHDEVELYSILSFSDKYNENELRHIHSEKSISNSKTSDFNFFMKHDNIQNNSSCSKDDSKIYCGYDNNSLKGKNAFEFETTNYCINLYFR
jgi:hypothetical protein